MKVVAIQHDIVWQAPPANFERLAPMIASVAAGGARLVLLTEMYATGFGIETAAIAEPPGGPSTQFLYEQASQHGCWIGASVPERSDADDTARPTTPSCPLRPTVCALLSQDPSVQLRPRARTLRERHRACDRRRRRAALCPVRVLRPALRRRVLGARSAGHFLDRKVIETVQKLASHSPFFICVFVRKILRARPRLLEFCRWNQESAKRMVFAIFLSQP